MDLSYVAISRMHILLINGPNLNLLGTREPATYGSDTLDDIVRRAMLQASDADAMLTAYQSNSEGDIVSNIHKATNQGVNFIVINAGAYTHTSIAIRDALIGVAIPYIEVHISNVYAREPFRHHSYLSDKATAVIVGMGVYGYEAAIGYCLRKKS